MAQATPRPGIIDCDVHPGPKQIDEIKAFMKPPFKDRYSGGGRGFFVNPGAPWADMARLDSKPPNGDGPVTVEPAKPPTAELLVAVTYPVTVEADCIVLHL